MSSDLFYVDPLQLYFGDDFVLNEKIVIHQPTIQEIVRFGEKNYFGMIHAITATPSDMKSSLWDAGIDWEEIEDFDLFRLVAPTIDKEQSELLFGTEFDFSKLVPYVNEENGELALVDVENEIYIDKLVYMRIVNYLRKMHGLKANIERAKNKRTKQLLIELDRQQILQSKTKEYKSFLLPLISSVKVKMRYTKEHVLQMGIVEFMDDLERIQVVDKATHMLNGAYCGMVDASKFNKKDLNWLRDLSKD